MFKYTSILGLALYYILGLVLGACGINIIEEPLKFFGIILVVIAIDMNSAYIMWKVKDNV